MGKWSKNAERDKKIVDLFQELKSTRLVADVTGIHHKTVHHVLYQLGIPTPRKGRRHNPYAACDVQKELVLKLVKDGKSMNHIAEVVGTNPREVKKFLIRNGAMREFPHLSGSDHPNWTGGRRKAKHGYVHILAPDHPFAKKHTRDVPEHRLVMEKHLGRYLLPHEVVHHINGVNDDNRIENLQLFQSNGEHLKHELTGRVPKWTEDGKDRIRKGIVRAAELKRGTTRKKSGHDV